MFKPQCVKTMHCSIDLIRGIMSFYAWHQEEETIPILSFSVIYVQFIHTYEFHHLSWKYAVSRASSLSDCQWRACYELAQSRHKLMQVLCFHEINWILIQKNLLLFTCAGTIIWNFGMVLLAEIQTFALGTVLLCDKCIWKGSPFWHTWAHNALLLLLQIIGFGKLVQWLNQC